MMNCIVHKKQHEMNEGLDPIFRGKTTFWFPVHYVFKVQFSHFVL